MIRKGFPEEEASIGLGTEEFGKVDTDGVGMRTAMAGRQPVGKDTEAVTVTRADTPRQIHEHP